MRVRYLYSACVVIESADARILCDPWFTPGAYDGSWYQYPPLAHPVETIGPVDAIYISHVHPDHYDPAFLRRYLAVHPAARLLIGPQKPPHLANKMRIDGFRPEIVEALRLGDTELLIVPNQVDDDPKSEIDSALAVRAGGQAVVNLNDNAVVPAQVARLRDFCPEGKVGFALLPYSGAGPWPQTFEFPDPARLDAAAERKRQQFLGVFATYLELLDPVKAMPFAGKYWLGGPLRRLNRHRGVPDAVEAKAAHGDRVVVLADGGRAVYDLDTGKASAERLAPYDPAAVDAYLAGVDFRGYDYERELAPLPDRTLPILPLLTAAKRRARGRIRIDDSYWLVVRPDSGRHAFKLNLSDDAPPTIHPRDEPFEALTPRLEVMLDERYLFGLLSRLYHWNNAEVGSLYRSRRVPLDYRSDVYRFLDSLQV